MTSPVGKLSNQEPELRDVLAAIGKVMLCWGYLEALMLEKLWECGVACHPTAPPIQQWRNAGRQFGPVFASWTEEIEAVAAIRNKLAHTINGARSLPNPEVLCRAECGRIVVLSLSELELAARNIDDLRLRLRRESSDALLS